VLLNLIKNNYEFQSNKFVGNRAAFNERL